MKWYCRKNGGGFISEHIDENANIAIYMDTSGSMQSSFEFADGDSGSGSRKIRKVRSEIALEIWSEINENLSPIPVTVRTIDSRGHSKTLLKLKKHNESKLANLRFPDFLGGTYLWEFLVEEGRELVKVSDKWIFLLISDGEDLESSGVFNGVEGFRPCVEELQKLNIDVEFHIIGLGLPEDVADTYRQVSGATGGVFHNLGLNEEDTSSVQDIVDEMKIAIDEAIDPALRARSRRRRQATYLESCKDDDLKIIKIPSLYPEMEFDSEGIYASMGISDLNPDKMEVWETSLHSISGHRGADIVTEDNWSICTSHSSDHRLDTTIRRTWTIDASKLATAMASDPNVYFDLHRDINHTYIPPECLSVVIRGRINEKLLKTIQGLGTKIVILPSDLPPPQLSWEKTEEYLKYGDNPFALGGWSILPLAHNNPTKYALMYDFYKEIDLSVYVEALGVKQMHDWISDIGVMTNEMYRFLEPEFYTNIDGINPELAKIISMQLRGLIKYGIKSLTENAKVLVIRPDFGLKIMMEENINFQTEFLNIIDDFFELICDRRNFAKLNIEYWPTLDQG